MTTVCSQATAIDATDEIPPVGCWNRPINTRTRQLRVIGGSRSGRVLTADLINANRLGAGLGVPFETARLASGGRGGAGAGPR